MLRTDLPKDLVVHPVLSVHGITAQNIHVVCAGEFVAKPFYLNRGLCISMSPQKMHALAKDGNAAVVSVRSRCSRHQKIAPQRHKSIGIGHAVEHEGRKGRSRIHLDISSLLHSSIEVETMFL